uniref:CARD domain-containing protein n=1 Tax=Neogobius melanostomus TaxID=47308 RepID=A0A8C6T8Q7_9GOBI
MAGVLAKVRTGFAERVTTEVLKQLLEDLLEDRVLNEGEKDSILEENMSRADRARALIASVKRKGDDASEKMMGRLQQRDPTLYFELIIKQGHNTQ